MGDSMEMEKLRMENDFAYLFGKPTSQPIKNDPLPDPEILNMRNVNYLQIQLKTITMAGKQFQDKPIQVTVRIPMIRNGDIDYQTHQTYDIGKNGKQILFNAQFRSNFQLNDKIMGQLNSVVVYFQITSLDTEIGKAEFPLQNMIADGLKSFTYTVAATQTIQQKGKKGGKVDKVVETAQIEFDLQLQDFSGRENQQSSPKKEAKEIDIEEQTEKIKEQILLQMQREKERKQQAKQQQQQEINQQIIQQLSAFQLYLKIGKLVHINREQCLAKVNDDQLNLYIKFKSYGTQEINQTETNWNALQWILNYPVTCSVTFDSVNKMFNIPWIIELWSQHTQTNEDILIGITRLQLSMINASIFTHNPLISINILKNNLYPLMLYDQDIPFEDLRTKKTMAIFRIKTAFGTTAQITRLVNQEIPIQKEPSESDQEPEEIPITEVNEPEKPPESPVEQKENVQEKFTLQDSLLTILNKICQTIRILPKEQYILKEEFIEIVIQLCNANFNKRIIEQLSQYIQLDQQTLDWHIFLQSWQAFSNYKKQLQSKYTKIYANFYSQAMKIFQSINAMERELPHGAFGLLDQQELREFLLNCKGGNIPSGPSFSAITINSVFETLEINENEQVQLTDLVDYLRQFELYGEISKMYVPIIQIAAILEKNIQIWVQANKQLIDNYLEEREFKQLKAFDIIQIFQDLGLSVTLLDAVVIMNQIGDYNNVEDHDGQKVCTEIAFWKYIDWLFQTDIVPKEPLSPLKPPQAKVNGPKVPQPIDFQFLETKLIIDLVQISYHEGEKYQIQLQLENTAFNVATPKTQILNPQFYENGQIPINLRAVCTLCDKFSHDFKKTLIERLQYSGVSIMLFKDNQILRGSVAIEEILCIQDEKETFFVQLFDEIKHSDTSLIEFKISIKQTVKDEKSTEGFQLYNTEGQIPLQAIISTEEILEIIKPEISHTFRINIKQINWFKNMKFERLKVKVSLATDKKILKEAIPCFTSDDFNNDFDIVVEYQVKCDQVLATQISKCHLQIQLILQSDSQNKILIGYLPIKPLFEDQKVAGEIPLDDSSTGAFACTLNLDASYSTDRVEQQVQNEEKLKFQKKVIIRVLEMILLDYNNELGEIYFMLVDPLNMSESYEVRPNTPSILNTQDCIFILSENELQSDVVELQVRSVMLGEDKIIGNVLIQLSQIQNEGIYSDSNYLRVDTKIPDLQARVGIKIIYICATETCNDNYLNAFRYPAIKDLESQSIEQYLRNKLHFSYSEINFMTSLIKDEVFSSSILQPLNLQSDQQIVLDLFKEFAFYDSNNQRYVNPNVLATVFGYFQLKDCRDQFIQSIHKRKPQDHECPPNQFDYLTFLAHLQKSTPNASPLFQVNIQGPIQHEVQQVIKKTPQKQPEEPTIKPAFRQLHFHFECGKNLNALSKRVPNAILKFPQLDQESSVFYSSSNPEFDALVSVDATKLKNLQIQIFDKKYNPADDKQIYKNILIGEAVIEFSQLKPTYPQIFTLQLNSTDQSFTQTKIPYLQIKAWTENEEIIPIKRSPVKPKGEKETVRKLVFDEDEKGQENSTIKNLQKELDDYLQSLKKPKQEEAKKEEKKSEKSSPPKPKKIEKVKYSSSGSSSQPAQPKSSSSGNRLEKIDEKLPINGDHLKRIEKILRQNNLPINKYDGLSDDSDYE